MVTAIEHVEEFEGQLRQGDFLTLIGMAVDSVETDLQVFEDLSRRFEAGEFDDIARSFAKEWEDVEKYLDTIRLEVLKKQLRLTLTKPDGIATSEEQVRLPAKFATLKKNLNPTPKVAKATADSSAPSTHGTVAELARKFNISKSEVRRMRAAGTLDEFIAGRSSNVQH